MSALTPASEVILRQKDTFIARQVIISGDIQDLLPAMIEAGRVRVHTFWYHHKKILARALGDQLVSFDVITSATMVKGYDTLIYFWPKNKPEALFQLTNLLSLLPLGCDVFIVGENRNGVRSVECMLKAWCTLRKIDSARHCGLYHGQLNHHPHFNVDDYWQTYKVNKVVIKTLPGVFSRNRLDKGSQLLLSTFDRPLIGHVADIGCGSGVLSVVLASRSQEKVKLILIDAYAPALAASRATLEANGLRGEVLAGDVYSAISGRFNMIISNPPFHDGIQINLQTAQTLIRGARDHLHVGGELRIVANAFLSYSNLLNEVFGSHQVLAQDGHFKVYQAFNHKKI